MCTWGGMNGHIFQTIENGNLLTYLPHSPKKILSDDTRTKCVRPPAAEIQQVV